MNPLPGTEFNVQAAIAGINAHEDQSVFFPERYRGEYVCKGLEYDGKRLTFEPIAKDAL